MTEHIKPWSARAKEDGHSFQPACYMQAEIDDLRAALSQQAPAKALTDELPELPFSHYRHIDFAATPNSTALYTPDQMREYASAAIIAAQPAASVPADKNAERYLHLRNTHSWEPAIWAAIDFLGPDEDYGKALDDAVDASIAAAPSPDSEKP